MDLTPHLPNVLVSERIKFVDTLVKAGRIDEAVKEIESIRQIDPANPYAHAYAERLQTIKSELVAQAKTYEADRVGQSSSAEGCPDHPGAGRELSEKGLAGSAGNRTEDSSRPEKERHPSVLGFPALRSVFSEPRSNLKANIVLVDDDELLLMALVELLEDNKYSTKAFKKSEDALDYLKGHKPDLILCDVNIQDSSMGGFTFFEKTTKLGHLHNVPFIFLSGLIDEAIIRAGKELGADDYLTKPIEPDLLLSVIKGKLRKYKLSEKNH